MIIEDNQGAVEWDWSDRNKKTGQQSEAEDAIIFELQDDGKISYWREYIEKKDNLAVFKTGSNYLDHKNKINGAFCP